MRSGDAWSVEGEDRMTSPVSQDSACLIHGCGRYPPRELMDVFIFSVHAADS